MAVLPLRCMVVLLILNAPGCLFVLLQAGQQVPSVMIQEQPASFSPGIATVGEQQR